MSWLITSGIHTYPKISIAMVALKITHKLYHFTCYHLMFISIPHPLQIFFTFQRWGVITELPWTPLLNQHSMYTSTTILLSSFLNLFLDCITLTPLSLINPQLKLTHFSPPLKTTNHNLVNVKLKERIELTTYRENMAGLMYENTKISLPTIK